MIKPDRFEVIRIPQACWSAALDALRAAGGRGLEVIVYFAGTFTGTTGTVTRVIVPRQRQSAGGCEPDLDEVNRISADIVAAGEVLLWQMHSHPGTAYLSGTDRAWPVSRKIGWISAVAPSFGSGVSETTDIRIYEYLGGDTWRELDVEERRTRLRVA
jgi:proteasome lid subunit RPN8/RPN11